MLLSVLIIITSLASSIALLYLFSRFILFLTKKFWRPSKLQERILVVIITAIYISIGISIYLNYLWAPEKYDPHYLNWLNTTPFWEQFLDITTWPMPYLFNRTN